jgi:hypothetical protein
VATPATSNQRSEETVLRWRTTLAITASLGCLAFAAAPERPESASSGTIAIVGYHGRLSGHDIRPFRITVAGKAPTGLHPGTTKDMAVSIENPYDFALRVEGLRGEVVETSRRKCKPHNLLVRTYVGRLPLTVAARGRTRAGTIPLFMPLDANQACAGAVFTIRLSGNATKAVR